MNVQKTGTKKRIRYRINGTVQGVGFRPFIYRLAHRFDIAGFVTNDSHGVLIEAEAQAGVLASFEQAIRNELPPLAKITALATETIPPVGEASFVIKKSAVLDERKAFITPDAAICDDCLREMFDPHDRRYRYPFINCTNCGPRHTIIMDIPYDRPNTTMRSFTMCPRCQAEYDDPLSRRFHAQPNACPDCGPSLSFHDAQGAELAVADPINAAIEALRRGAFVAVKGLGGYHLACDATNARAVAELRRRKMREEKPFAIMSRDVDHVKQYARVSESEQALLESVERPIVLLQKKKSSLIADEVAPHSKYLGAMLCYTPVHYLLFEGGFLALVMTSANLSDEPIAKDEDDALTRLAGIADYFLTNNRPIFTRSDDSVARVIFDQPALVRRSRGYVPFPILLKKDFSRPVLAVGAELKNTICLAKGPNAYVSQHIGDLKNARAYGFFKETVAYLQKILAIEPALVVHDLHPGYLSSRFAQALALPRVTVQHHFAHIVSVLGEHNFFDEPVIGIAADGTGLGTDGAIWGCEIFETTCSQFTRLGHLRYFPLPGGDKAVEEPPRSAYAYLYETLGKDALSSLDCAPNRELTEETRRNLEVMIKRRVNAPLTSSLGRLFDVASSLLDICQHNTYEGQAPVMLENAAIESESGHYPFAIVPDDESPDRFIIDPAEVLKGVLDDIAKGDAAGNIAARFHNTVVQFLAQSTKRARDITHLNTVALSGGVFQNMYLLTRLVNALCKDGFEVLMHKELPPNDGCIAFGQAVVGDIIFSKENHPSQNEKD